MATSKTAKNRRKPARSRAKPVKRTAAHKTVAKPSAAINEIEENSVAALANSADISADSEVNATNSETVVESKEGATEETVVEATTTSKSTDVALLSEGASKRKVFKMKNMEIPNAVREVAEKTIEQAQATYDKFKTSAEEANNILEDSIETSRKGMINLQEKVLDVAKTNTEATFDFCKSMVSVRSFSEALELHSGFAREQYETFTSQSKDIQDMTTQLIDDVTSPAKDAVEKAISELNAA